MELVFFILKNLTAILPLVFFLSIIVNLIIYRLQSDQRLSLGWHMKNSLKLIGWSYGIILAVILSTLLLTRFVIWWLWVVDTLFSTTSVSL